MLCDCGHTVESPETGGTGYAVLHDGRKLCYACSDAHELTNFLAADSYTCYVSTNGRHLTTWPGGVLARVTILRQVRNGFYGSPICHWRAEAADGSRWYGKGAGKGQITTARRAAT